jgi:tetratricopeptide (TPR) repeat protein/anti-sigma regulatory factor (Ser/Thr protein kinase)
MSPQDDVPQLKRPVRPQPLADHRSSADQGQKSKNNLLSAAKRPRYRSDHQMLEASTLQLVREGTKYGNALAKKGRYQAAFAEFEQCLELDPSNIITRNSYANALTKAKCYDEAFQQFQQCLKLDSQDVRTLNSYGNALASAGRYDEAFQLFQQCLKLDSQNIQVLNSYGNALASAGRYDEAFQLFQQSLKLDSQNVPTFNSYGNALASAGRYDEAFQLFQQSLKLDSQHVPTLNSYGNALASAGRYDEAFQLFQQSLKLDSQDVRTLNSYGNALASAGRYDEAFQLFQQCLKLDSQNIQVLNSYGNALASAGRYDEAFQQFRQCLKLDSQHVITYLCFARWLEHDGQYNQACQQLETIKTSQLTPAYSTLIYLNLGRLYYRLKQPKQGKQYIQQALQTANDEDKAKLQAAQNIFVTQPGSAEAIQLLQTITETSPRYRAAMKAIGLHGDSKTTFEHFSDQSSSLQATEMLYRSTYHKIINEIAVLKSIAYRLARNLAAEHPLVNEIIQLLEDLLISIKEQRTSEKASLEAIPHGDYDAILNIVAETAHNIADHVNNQIFVIISKVRRAQRNLDLDEPQAQRLEKLLTQLEITQNALNELKAINESFQVKKQTFPVENLFVKWQDTQNKGAINLDNARIYLEIKNPQTELNSDEEKLKSILNELIENSLKHNRDLDYFRIRIQSRDLVNPYELSGKGIPGQRPFVNITLRDQGKGIPADKKEWIFQPLHTTSAENEGSGLGLYIARQVIKSLGGYILEDGKPGHGARFKIFLPLSEF